MGIRMFTSIAERISLVCFRQYEQREMRVFAEVEEQIRKFDSEVSRLQSELDFLNSDDRNGEHGILFVVMPYV